MFLLLTVMRILLIASIIKLKEINFKQGNWIEMILVTYLIISFGYFLKKDFLMKILKAL